MSNSNLDDVVEAALDAFWGTVVEHYPHAQSGDLNPATCFRFSRLAKEAIEEWIFLNVP